MTFLKEFSLMLFVTGLLVLVGQKVHVENTYFSLEGLALACVCVIISLSLVGYCNALRREAENNKYKVKGD